MVQLACILVALEIILICISIERKLDEREESRKVEISKQMESYNPKSNPAHISQSRPSEELDTAESTLYW